MKPSTLLFFLCSFFILISCGDDNDEEEVMDDPDTIEEENPLPNQTSTFTTHVEPIMNTYCSRCHGDPLANGAPVMFVTFDQVVSGVTERNLLERMESTGNNVMPPDGRLDQATIDIVDDWIADGLLE